MLASSPDPPRPPFPVVGSAPRSVADDPVEDGTDPRRAIASIRALLDESVFHAARGDRPPVRVVRGAPHEVWGSLNAGPLAAARQEYHSFDDPGVPLRMGMSESILGPCSSAMRAMVDRGVRVRQVTTRAGLLADSRELPGIMYRHGGQARTTDRWPFKATVIDRTLALVPADFAMMINGTLLVRDPVVVEALLALHDTLWRYGQPAVRPDDVLPRHLPPVLRTLTSGLPDEAAARTLKLSPRTYSRRVSELIEVLGVRSRFQAGHEAARRGWLDA